MKILVTGANGFIGRYVIKEILSKTNHNIIATSRSLQNNHLLAQTNRRLTFIQKDLSESEDNYYTFFHEPDLCIHLAWPGLPNYNQTFHLENNLPADIRFLKNLLTCGLKDLSVAGTCFEYGLANGPMKEETPANPVTLYGVAKDSLRKTLETLQASLNYNLRWLRIFYPFGDGQSKSSLLELLKEAIDKKQLVFNMSKGEQIRDFLPIEEMAQLIVACSLQSTTLGIINCCSGKPISVRSFVDHFLETNHFNITLNRGHYPYPDYEPLAFWGDTKKLSLALNLGPKYE